MNQRRLHQTVLGAVIALFGFLVLVVVPISVSAQAGTNTGTATINYNAQIKIPGSSESAQYLAGNNPVSNNLFGQWVDTVYRFCMWLAITLAIFMMMVGGFLWVIAGGSPQRVENAKSYITSSITGLVLALTSFLLLQTVNPQLVVFKPLSGVEAPTGLEDAGCCCYTTQGSAVLACAPSTCTPYNPDPNRSMEESQQAHDQFVGTTCGKIAGTGVQADSHWDKSCFGGAPLSHWGSSGRRGATTRLTEMRFYGSCSGSLTTPEETVDLTGEWSTACCNIPYDETLGIVNYTASYNICFAVPDLKTCETKSKEIAQRMKITSTTGNFGVFIGMPCDVAARDIIKAPCFSP